MRKLTIKSTLSLYLTNGAGNQPNKIPIRYLKLELGRNVQGFPIIL